MKITLGRGLVALGGVLVVINVASAIWDVRIDRDRTESRARRDLSNISGLLAEQTAAVLEAVDLVLRDAARGGPAAKAAAVIMPRLRDEMTHIPQVAAFLVVDADGRIVGRTNETPSIRSDYAERWFSTAHRDGRAGGLLLSEPYQGGPDGKKWRFVMSRRLDAPGGAFGGIIAAVMETENFDRLYRTIDLGEGGFINLSTRDGIIITRVPDAPEARKRRFHNPKVSVAVEREGRFTGWLLSKIMNQTVLESIVSVRGFPLDVLAGSTEYAVFAPWRSEAWRIALRTLLTSAAMLVLIALAAWGLARREREREEMQRQLQQAAKMEAIGRLAGGIAHDFNNILGAILGYGEMAQKNLEGRAVRRHVDQVMQAGARGKGLVERILAFSRSGLGERVPVHVQSVVEETLEILAASLLPQVRLEKRLDVGDTAVVGDATQLHQVAMNLCTNALQAMEHGGVLTVALDRVAVAERRLLSHGTLLPGPYVRLSVSDTGSGIPPAVLERMFDPFFTTKGVGDGTGLGLSLVHGIVADFGGAIDVKTQAGAGTTFTVWLPASGETPRILAEPAGDLPLGEGEAVMIVDDERSLVALAEETLAELGYEPAGFDSSVAALQAFRADPQRFDLVLTDETMPDMSGVDLAREIRRVRPELPIVLMSGYSGAQLTERARATGVAEVLRKPLVRRDIAEALARALQ